ncbi:hypothetical protein [Cognatishimia sp.]|uniref:hypothetical protein n=1 Tax=Cognatishimia sp. TaxID=2211648 RepID=UPI003513EA0B|nr:hypothetical protein [Cognatishimia sp.]
MKQGDLEPLIVRKVFVIGFAKWLYEFTSLDDAVACIYELERQMKSEGTELNFIEARVEFITGESERCAFIDRERVYAWLDRFR